jgi:uncharacterized membrane protein
MASIVILVIVFHGNIVAPSPAGPPATFQGIGDLPGGDYYSAFGAISGDGRTIVGRSSSAAGEEAFRWTAVDGIAGIGDLPGGTFRSAANGVSYDGTVIVGHGNAVQDPVTQVVIEYEAYRWTSDDGFTSLGDFSGGSGISFAASVSDDGAVIVGTGDIVYDPIFPTYEVSGRMFRWTADTGIEWLGDLPEGSPYSWGGRISGDGTTIVGTGNFFTDPFLGGQLGEAFRWTETGGMAGLGLLPGGSFSTASGVSADGSVICGWSLDLSGFSAEPFIWTQADGMVGLGIPEGFDFSAVYDMSADGSIVVGQALSFTAPAEAAIWDKIHGYRLVSDVLANDFGLDLGAWRLEIASGISDDGMVICGTGINPNGDFEVWVATGLFAGAEPADGDFDGDGDVDLADYQRFNTCLTGPAEMIEGAECEPGDADGDGDVDLSDFKLFQQSFTGAS